MNFNCKICNNSNSWNYINNTDDYSNEDFLINICKGCGVGITVTDENITLEDYYPNVYYGEQRKRFSSLIESIVKFFRIFRVSYILRNSNNTINNKLSILDIGCGRATELELLNKHGWNCYGTEHSVENLESLNNKGIKIIDEDDLHKCNFSDNQFDVITLWHSFEHLIDPVKTLHEISRIMKDDGSLIIEIPNFNSWQARINRSKWIYTESPRHLYHYTAKSINCLFKINNMKINKLSTISFEFGPIGFITNLFNAFISEKNFLFKLLFKKNEFRMLVKSKSKILINYFLLFLFIIPVIFIGTTLELISTIFRSGAVLRIIAKKS